MCVTIGAASDDGGAAFERVSQLAAAQSADHAQTVADDQAVRTRLTRTLAAIESLDDIGRELLTLAVWEELSYREIAAAMNMPIGTVRSSSVESGANLGDVLDLALIEPDFIGCISKVPATTPAPQLAVVGLVAPSTGLTDLAGDDADIVDEGDWAWAVVQRGDAPVVLVYFDLGTVDMMFLVAGVTDENAQAVAADFEERVRAQIPTMLSELRVHPNLDSLLLTADG